LFFEKKGSSQPEATTKKVQREYCDLCENFGHTKTACPNVTKEELEGLFFAFFFFYFFKKKKIKLKQKQIKNKNK
jgi:hypothetical protein